MTAPPASVEFWHTVWLLLNTAARRSAGRRRHQHELLQGRQGTNALASLGVILAVITAAFAHGVYFFALQGVLILSEHHAVERDGRMLVSEAFARDVVVQAKNNARAIREEASSRQWTFGGERENHETQLRRQLDEHGASGFVVRDASRTVAGVATVGRAGALGLGAALVVVVLWFLMMAFQGEGLELDVQRHRNPMWEWLFSHPIPPGAAFLAEMLAPLAANPSFATAPVFCGMVFAHVYGAAGVLPGVVVGAAMAVAASCFSKAIEIGAMLRLSQRSRGAVLGVMSWVGYSSLVVAFFAVAHRGVLIALLTAVDRLTWLVPITPTRWLFGVMANGETSLPLAIVSCLMVAAAIGAISVWGSARATNAGIVRGTTVVVTDAHYRLREARVPLVRDPLLRKELLWFWRDRSAVVQAILIPLTVGAFQALQFGRLAKQAGDSWNWLCGLGVICGTYFLLIVGPRSLASEGGALWLALTWPRGLEPLLKAKARLWWIISSMLVCVVLGLAFVRFPNDTPEIACVAAAWLVFGRSLAEKAVTLVGAPSSSGQPEPVPAGRQMAATLGTFSFASGVIVQNWHLAAMGVIFSTLTSAAMWQNFRERLPFLFDPRSERLPTPPTLMHAMVAITAMVDGMAIIVVPCGLLLGAGGVMLVQSAAYGVSALITSLAVTEFLSQRGVPGSLLWTWRSEERSHGPAFLDRLRGVGTLQSQMVVAAGLGAALGAVALGYSAYISDIPFVAERLEVMAKHFTDHPWDKLWIFVATVGFAPLAEEYLFRGLLFRALDREWGGARAILGSALFFGVYHPPLSWLPVGLMGVLLACLFKVTGSLWPCVIAHAVYNAIVTLAA